MTPYENIQNKKDKAVTKVVIPVVKPDEKMNDVKRKIY